MAHGTNLIKTESKLYKKTPHNCSLKIRYELPNEILQIKKKEILQIRKLIDQNHQNIRYQITIQCREQDEPSKWLQKGSSWKAYCNDLS